MFEKGRCRQHDVGHRCGLGQKLLVHAHKEIVPGETLPHQPGFRRDHHRVGVLNHQRRDRRSAAEVALVAGEDRADARLVEDARPVIDDVEPFKQRPVEPEPLMVRVMRTAALVLPGAGHRRQAGHRMHLRRAVARAREAIADPDKAAIRLAVQPGEFDDLLRRKAGDAGGPFRRALPQMCFEPGWIVGVPRHVCAVGIALGEQHMHDGAGERAVGAGQRRQVQIGDRGGAGAVRVNDHELGAAPMPRLGDVLHHVDLGRNRVAAPDHHEVCLGDFAPVDAAHRSDPGEPAGIGQRVADRRVLPRIAQHMPETLNAVALHPAHRAGVEMRPHRFGAVPLRRRHHPFGD